jgi:hypothetical protein
LVGTTWCHDMMCLSVCMAACEPCLNAPFVVVCLPPPDTHTHTHTHTAEEATREQRAGLGRTDPQSQGGQGLRIYLSPLMIRYFVGSTDDLLHSRVQGCIVASSVALRVCTRPEAGCLSPKTRVSQVSCCACARPATPASRLAKT